MDGLVIAIGIIAIAAGITLTVLFFSAKNEGKFKGFMGWFYNFVNYKEELIKYILIALKYIWKSIYLIGAIGITLYAIIMPIYMLTQPYMPASKAIECFFLALIVGNIVWRLACELIPIIVLFLPRIIRKFFRWYISVPRRPRPVIIKKDEAVETAPENVPSWNYFKAPKA